MKLASSCIQLLERVSRIIDTRIDRAISEERDRRYINTLSEVQSFIKQVKEFMNTLKTLEAMNVDLVHGRLCFRWIYAENGPNLSLVKFEPRFSILYTQNKLQISSDDRSITLYEGLKMDFVVNMYSDSVDLSDEEDTINKRSLILDAVSKVSESLAKSIDNINLCIKYARHK